MVKLIEGRPNDHVPDIFEGGMGPMTYGRLS